MTMGRAGIGRTWPAVLVVAAVLSACAGRRASTPFAGGGEDYDIPVEVDNHNYLDIVVFAMQGEATNRLGSVTGLSSRSLTVPGQLVVAGRIRLLVDPVGSREAYLTEDIMVNPGDVVVLQVGSVIRQSSWSVR